MQMQMQTHNCLHAAVTDSAQLVVKYGSLSVENGRTISPEEVPFLLLLLGVVIP